VYYIGHHEQLSLAAQTQDGLAITGLLLMVIGASLFTFTLVLHAAALATRRSSVRASNAPRSRSYGEHRPLTPVDRFGVWLRSLAVRRQADLAGKRIADFGCGFDARFTRSMPVQVASACLVDVHLAEDLKHHSEVSAMEGTIEEVLPAIRMPRSTPSSACRCSSI
jgi:hypothetical protein